MCVCGEENNLSGYDLLYIYNYLHESHSILLCNINYHFI